MPLKVMTIVGTRPEIIKLSRTICALDKVMNHTLVHTGQNYDYELNEIFFKELGIRKPDYFLESSKDGVAKAIGDIIQKTDEVLAKEKPDAVLYYGDTNSCLGIIAAKRRKIPIFHMEAGNRCFDLRVPEEINRKVVDHLSDINMVHSEHARRYLLNEGIRPETIIKTGSPMGEILEHYKDQIDSSTILKEMNLSKGEYFLVSTHREENIDSPENFNNLIKSLNKLAQRYNLPVIVSTHPRTRKKIDSIKSISTHEKINFVKPLGFNAYIHLQQNAKCVISDSGTLTEEASYLGFPGVMIRNSHERPEGMDAGTVIMAGLNEDSVIDSVNLAIEYHTEKTASITDYTYNQVSSHVVKLIQSYTGYINRTVWFKGNDNV